MGIVPSIDAIQYHTMLLFDQALDHGLDLTDAMRFTAYHAEHQFYDFAFGRFKFQGLRQKFWLPFEVEHRLKKAGFHGIHLSKVLYPWDESLAGSRELDDRSPELGLVLRGQPVLRDQRRRSRRRHCQEDRFTLGLSGVRNPAAGSSRESVPCVPNGAACPSRNSRSRSGNKSFTTSPRRLCLAKPPVKPFPIYLRETPAVPMSSGVKATLWIVGIVVLLLLIAALWRTQRPSRLRRAPGATKAALMNVAPLLPSHGRRWKG